MSSSTDTGKLVDHLFRHEAGKMVAVLTHFFGLANLQLAEDVVQESFIKALQSWKLNGPPENPQAWLLKVAKNKAIDLLRRQQLHNKVSKEQAEELEESAGIFFHEQEIADSQLRMIFACCHPALRQEDQVALTLKIVSGFSMAEIARALITTEAVVQKRISRAKAYLRENAVHLEIPAGAALQARLDTVYTILYLVFNEGYNSLKADELIRQDLCAEAMRCCKLLTEHALVKQPIAHALLALMCLHAARFDSRIGADNAIILLQEQDRSLWDHALISVGFRYLNLSSAGAQISAYHVEAAIAAEHALAPAFAATNWARLLELYDLLLQVKPAPVTWLNRAVILAQTGEIESAIASILSIQHIDLLLRSDHIYSAVLGDLYKRLSDTVKAKAYFMQAQSLTPSFAEKKLLQLRLDELVQKSN
ncbi:MAG: sigma-70 family polymerase sigma factor [Sediminibacterium sp.]|nr:sigma-70 family polymerase sigma factor [Sediminibacterium sp.]